MERGEREGPGKGREGRSRKGGEREGSGEGEDKFGCGGVPAHD